MNSFLIIKALLFPTPFRAASLWCEGQGIRAQLFREGTVEDFGSGLGFWFGFRVERERAETTVAPGRVLNKPNHAPNFSNSLKVPKP